MSDLYEADITLWANRQADALRRRAANEIDWDNVAEEIADVARRNEDRIEGALGTAIVHLLKWQFQPVMRSNAWKAAVVAERYRIARLIRRNPSLASWPATVLVEIYPAARGQAEAGTGVERAAGSLSMDDRAGAGSCVLAGTAAHEKRPRRSTSCGAHGSRGADRRAAGTPRRPCLGSRAAARCTRPGAVPASRGRAPAGSSGRTAGCAEEGCVRRSPDPFERLGAFIDALAEQALVVRSCGVLRSEGRSVIRNIWHRYRERATLEPSQGQSTGENKRAHGRIPRAVTPRAPINGSEPAIIRTPSGSSA